MIFISVSYTHLDVYKRQDILNINREEIMCLGDSENDLSMIEFAGLGVAMGNAEEFLKEKEMCIRDSFKTVRYTDEAIKMFMDKLKEEGR